MLDITIGKDALRDVTTAADEIYQLVASIYGPSNRRILVTGGEVPSQSHTSSQGLLGHLVQCYEPSDPRQFVAATFSKLARSSHTRAGMGGKASVLFSAALVREAGQAIEAGCTLSDVLLGIREAQNRSLAEIENLCQSATTPELVSTGKQAAPRLGRLVSDLVETIRQNPHARFTTHSSHDDSRILPVSQFQIPGQLSFRPGIHLKSNPKHVIFGFSRLHSSIFDVIDAADTDQTAVVLVPADRAGRFESSKEEMAKCEALITERSAILFTVSTNSSDTEAISDIVAALDGLLDLQSTSPVNVSIGRRCLIVGPLLHANVSDESTQGLSALDRQGMTGQPPSNERMIPADRTSEWIAAVLDSRAYMVTNSGDDYDLKSCLTAISSSINDGVVLGEGNTGYMLSQALIDGDFDSTLQHGVNAMSQALQRPMACLMSAAGLEPNRLLNRLVASRGQIFDLSSGAICLPEDRNGAPIVEPIGVWRTALTEGVEAAIALLSTRGLVTVDSDAPNDEFFREDRMGAPRRRRRPTPEV